MCRQVPSWFGFVTCRHDNVHALRPHPASETRTNHISPPAGDCGSSPRRSAATPEPSRPLREFHFVLSRTRRSALPQACSRRDFLAFCTTLKAACEPSPLRRSQMPSNRPQALRRASCAACCSARHDQRRRSCPDCSAVGAKWHRISLSRRAPCVGLKYGRSAGTDFACVSQLVYPPSAA